MRTSYVILTAFLAASCSDGGGFGSLGGGKSKDDKKDVGGSLETEDEPTTIPQDVSGSFLTDCNPVGTKPAGLEAAEEVIACTVHEKGTKTLVSSPVKVKSLKLEFRGIKNPHDVAKIVDGDASAHAYAGVPAGHAKLITKITARVSVDGKDHTTVHTRVVEGPTPTALTLKPEMVSGSFAADAGKLIDDNPDTAATADASTIPALIVDLGAPKELLFVKAFLQTENEGGGTRHKLSGGLSLDDLKPLKSFDLATAKNGDELAWSTADAVSIRYLKLETTGADGMTGWREFQVFAK